MGASSVRTDVGLIGRGCVNCSRNLGYWNDWASKYRSTDDAVLSVHTHETRTERALAATARFARDHGLRSPVLVAD